MQSPANSQPMMYGGFEVPDYVRRQGRQQLLLQLGSALLAGAGTNDLSRVPQALASGYQARQGVLEDFLRSKTLEEERQYRVEDRANAASDRLRDIENDKLRADLLSLQIEESKGGISEREAEKLRQNQLLTSRISQSSKDVSYLANRYGEEDPRVIRLRGLMSRAENGDVKALDSIDQEFEQLSGLVGLQDRQGAIRDIERREDLEDIAAGTRVDPRVQNMNTYSSINARDRRSARATEDDDSVSSNSLGTRVRMAVKDELERIEKSEGIGLGLADRNLASIDSDPDLSPAANKRRVEEATIRGIEAVSRETGISPRRIISMQGGDPEVVFPLDKQLVPLRDRLRERIVAAGTDEERSRLVDQAIEELRANGVSDDQIQEILETL